jgi:low-affinity ferrous iron transport protein
LLIFPIQILISDIQAILCYVFDSLLMRQQLNTYDESLGVAAQLQSRAQSNLRMLNKVRDMINTQQLEYSAGKGRRQSSAQTEVELPVEKWFSRWTARLADILGHLGFWAVYWCTIFLWLGFGHMNEWSNDWELYMNSATSALMVFVFAFLANIRELDSKYVTTCMSATFNVDSALEKRLRTLTGDALPNDTVVIPAPRVNWLQRAIYYYADVIGTLVGIALLLAVVVVWIAIGPALQFNSNWWLLIGTYAGLIGLHDSFILRNVQARFHEHETAQFNNVNVLDDSLQRAAHMPGICEDKTKVHSLSFRISAVVGHICAHEMTMLADVLLIVGLIIGSSAMHWNLTGQLLSNVPPSIIETFLMVVLITGHNSADTERRGQMKSLYERRVGLLRYVECIDPVLGGQGARRRASAF